MRCPPVKAGGYECICASRLEALFYREAKPLFSLRRLGPWPRAVVGFPFFFFFFFFFSVVFFVVLHGLFSIFHRHGVFLPYFRLPFFAV